MRVSLKDVAIKAGVSLSTVSKVMNGAGNISSETIKKVLAAAESLGYKPNRAAQLLSSKSKTIGILMPTEPIEIYSIFEAGLSDSMAYYEDFGFKFIIKKYAGDNDLHEVPQQIENLKDTVNGLILIPAYHHKHYSGMVKNLDFPVVLLQSVLLTDAFPSVTVDERLVGEMAAEFLSFTLSPGLRARKAAIIVGDKEGIIHKRNIEGFYEGAGRYSIEVIGVSESFDDMKTAYIQTRRLLESTADLGGIFVSSYVSPGVCRCIKDEGLTGKISVVGVDTTEENAKLLQNGEVDALIYQNQKLQASTSVDLLVSAMGGQPVTNVKIKPELVLKSNLCVYM